MATNRLIEGYIDLLKGVVAARGGDPSEVDREFPRPQPTPPAARNGLTTEKPALSPAPIEGSAPQEAPSSLFPPAPPSMAQNISRRATGSIRLDSLEAEPAQDSSGGMADWTPHSDFASRVAPSGSASGGGLEGHGGQSGSVLSSDLVPGLKGSSHDGIDEG